VRVGMVMINTERPVAKRCVAGVCGGVNLIAGAVRVSCAPDLEAAAGCADARPQRGLGFVRQGGSQQALSGY